METCENCGRTIGNLETPQLHDEHVVCAECYQKLAPQRIDYQDDTPTKNDVLAELAHARHTGAYVPPKAPRMVGSRCPVCGYVGMMKKVRKGSFIIMIFLLLLWILPGLIYAIVYNGFKFVCPKCGAKVADA